MAFAVPIFSEDFDSSKEPVRALYCHVSKITAEFIPAGHKAMEPFHYLWPVTWTSSTPKKKNTRPSKIKMASSNTYQNSITDEYIRELLECPVCLETIKSAPVYQCNNGHVICKDCIEKLNNCPICRNDFSLVRILKLEKIVQRLEGIPPENGGPTTVKPNIQKWGMESVRSYGTINGPNQEPLIETPIPQVAINQDEEAARQIREWDENYFRRNRTNILIILFCFLILLLNFLLFIFSFRMLGGSKKTQNTLR